MASNGAHASSWSGQPATSASGRFVAFASLAWNLAPVEGLNHRVYVHDRRTRRTLLISSARRDSTHPSISADGRVIAYTREDGRTSSVHVYNRRTRRTRQVDVSSREQRANGASFSSSISGTGRFVAFASEGGNLVHGDRNRGTDVFVRDQTKGTTSRVSLRLNGDPVQRCPQPRPEHPFPPLCPNGPAISATGRYVAFYTEIPRFDGADVRGGVFVHACGGRSRIPRLRSATSRTRG